MNIKLIRFQFFLCLSLLGMVGPLRGEEKIPAMVAEGIENPDVAVLSTTGEASAEGDETLRKMEALLQSLGGTGEVNPVVTDVEDAEGLPSPAELPGGTNFPSSESVTAGLGEGFLPNDPTAEMISQGNHAPSDGLFAPEVLAMAMGDGAAEMEDSRKVMPERIVYAVGITSGLTYDDNPFYASDDPQADVIFTLRPDLRVAFGDARDRQENYVQLAYAPTVIRFFDNTEENTIDQDFRAAGRYRRGKWTVDGESIATKSSEASIEVGDRFNRNEFSNKAELVYALSGKTSVKIRGRMENRRFQELQQFEDSDEVAGAVVIAWAPSQKTSIGVGYERGVLDFARSQSQRFQQGFVEAEWAPSPKLALTARTGLERRDFVVESVTTPVLEMGLSYQPREKTSLNLSVFRRNEVSTFLNGENFLETGIQLGLTQEIGQRFEVSLDGGFANSKYRGRGATTAGEREDDSFFVRAALRYRLREWLGVELFALHRENVSSSGGFGFENNQVGINAQLQF